MPAKPYWYGRITEVIARLEALPRPFVDRGQVESMLGVGRRRAQQIMAACVTDRVGASGLADRELLIARLRQWSEGEGAYYERQRRRKLAERLEGTPLLVEAPVRVVDQEFENLPSGVHLAPGRITVEFGEPKEALEKLLALAMAIGNDFERFERTTKSRTLTGRT